ncbi:hypothetical protein FQR65_LT11624 [Abscondita terminalis]|nr:hypothetical protein FQR65_LT11624 [Abscondita terminalis]
MGSKFLKVDGVVQNRKLSREEKRTRNRCLSISLPRSEIERFKDRQHGVHSDDYERLGKEPGLLVIFNQRTFNEEIRHGSNRDVNELILTFGRLGFNVDTEYIFTDLSKDELLNTVEKLSRVNFSDRNSLIMVVLSHGTKNDAIYTSDGYISANNIWEPFLNSKCSSFQNKPKFFIFQACKGNSFSQADKVNVDVFPESTFSATLEADMLIAYAAVEGTKSVRNLRTGTWFIQELCRNLNANGQREDVHSLLMRTTKCIANSYYYIDDDNTLIKQMPLFVSTLTKRFYLTLGKQRQLFLRTIKNQEEIIKEIKDIRILTHNRKKK